MMEGYTDCEREKGENHEMFYRFPLTFVLEIDRLFYFLPVSFHLFTCQFSASTNCMREVYSFTWRVGKHIAFSFQIKTNNNS